MMMEKSTLTASAPADCPISDDEEKSTLTAPADNPISDDELCEEGRVFHEMTEDELNRYYDSIERSLGFDVEDFPDAYTWYPILPYPVDTEDNRAYTLFAIDDHNKKYGGDLKLGHIIKWNRRFYTPWYADNFITFEAIDGANGEVGTYQTLVESGPTMEEWEVVIFRKKPNQENNGGIEDPMLRSRLLYGL